MNIIFKAFQFFNVISLNVVFGAVISSIMFWKLPDGSGIFDEASLILLGICTWIIYILDRILDLKIYPGKKTMRHLFHEKNQYNLSLLLIVLVFLAGVLSFFIPRPIFSYGLVLSIVLAVYFLVLNNVLKNKKMQWVKEPTTAICYCLAVIGIAFVDQSSINTSGWVLALMFFLIVSQNLLIFSYFENVSQTNQSNSATLFGEKNTLRIIRFLGFIVLFFAIFLFSNGWDYINKVGLVLAVMSQVLSFLPARQAYFSKNDRYRWLGDGVFLLPALLLIF
ncbi:MAG: hypothetical protein ACI8UX_000916 [Psychromonas sp.]|jgi:hypothetical protein